MKENIIFRQETQGGGNYIVNDNAAQHEFMMNQQAELEARRGDMLMVFVIDFLFH